MTLVQLRYLVGVVDAGLSISRATTSLYATQSGISKQLRRLEDELGFDIFVRQGRSFGAITKNGERVLEQARSIVAAAGEIKELRRR